MIKITNKLKLVLASKEWRQEDIANILGIKQYHISTLKRLTDGHYAKFTVVFPGILPVGDALRTARGQYTLSEIAGLVDLPTYDLSNLENLTVKNLIDLDRLLDAIIRRPARNINRKQFSSRVTLQVNVHHHHYLKSLPLPQ